MLLWSSRWTLEATEKLNYYRPFPKDMQNTSIDSSQRIAKRAVLIGTVLIIANRLLDSVCRNDLAHGTSNDGCDVC